MQESSQLCHCIPTAGLPLPENTLISTWLHYMCWLKDGWKFGWSLLNQPNFNPFMARLRLSSLAYLFWVSDSLYWSYRVRVASSQLAFPEGDKKWWSTYFWIYMFFFFNQRCFILIRLLIMIRPCSYVKKARNNCTECISEWKIWICMWCKCDNKRF